MTIRPGWPRPLEPQSKHRARHRASANRALPKLHGDFHSAFRIASGGRVPGAVGSMEIQQSEFRAGAQEIAPPGFTTWSGHVDGDNIPASAIADRYLEGVAGASPGVANDNKPLSDQTAQQGRIDQADRERVNGPGEAVLAEPLRHAAHATGDHSAGLVRARSAPINQAGLAARPK